MKIQYYVWCVQEGLLTHQWHNYDLHLTYAGLWTCAEIID